MKNKGIDIKHPKQRGEWAELRFMARAAEHGLCVTKPWGDSARYDFAVEHNGHFLRVQVKSTKSKQYNSYACNLRTTSHHAYTKDEVDFIAAYVIPKDVWYIIPIEVATNSSSNLILSPHLPNSKYDRYKEAWHLLRGEKDNPCGAGTCGAGALARVRSRQAKTHPQPTQAWPEVPRQNTQPTPIRSETWKSKSRRTTRKKTRKREPVPAGSRGAARPPIRKPRPQLLNQRILKQRLLSRPGREVRPLRTRRTVITLTFEAKWNGSPAC